MESENSDFIRKANALISYYFKIPFPEELSDEQWTEKWHQLKWLGHMKLLANNVS